jgi:hypothetical protein
MAASILTSVLDRVERSASPPCHLASGETATGTHWLADGEGPRVCQDAVEKCLLPLTRIELPTPRSSSRYTD